MKVGFASCPVTLYFLLPFLFKEIRAEGASMRSIELSGGTGGNAPVGETIHEVQAGSSAQTQVGDKDDGSSNSSEYSTSFL